MSCPFCNYIEHKTSYLPNTIFNGKKFDYFTCLNCKLIYISPIPNDDDFIKMYPPTYQNGVDTTILKNQYKKLPGLRFNYGYQFDLIKKYLPNGKILDYGCGNANFIVNANSQGFNIVGAEYNKEHIEFLKKSLPNEFYLIDEILNGEIGGFDIIRLSNVLEHLPNPIETIKILITKLNKNGILLIEGPMENNCNFAFLTRKLYFSIRKKMNKNWKVTHAPTHIFFSNRKNQRSFFKQFEIEELHFNIDEAEWPYPQSIKNAYGIGEKTKAIIAKISILLSSLFKNQGNIFIYVGKKQ